MEDRRGRLSACPGALKGRPYGDFNTLILNFMDPRMRRILMKRELALRAGDGPEIGEAIAGGGCHRVIPVREQDRVAVADRVRDRLAVGGVQHLMAEPLRRIDAVVINLFELRLAV